MAAQQVRKREEAAATAMEEGKSDCCVVCCSVCDIFAFGICDHSVCFECSTRMRVLCEQNECPICRQELEQVVFVRRVQKFADVRWNLWPVDRHYNIYFEHVSIKRSYEKLLEHVCNECRGVFNSLHQLKDHTRREHDRFFCELCVNSLKIFSFEYKSYTRAELAQHRRKGEANTSHRGHPLCEFCDERYVDRDELFRHVRRDHFFCHFCDADGTQEFFCDYADLRQHFLENHYLCEEGGCRDEKFTSVFRTDIDLKAHKATVHNKNMTKAQVKQARTLELAFPLVPRPQQHHHQQSNRGGANHDGLQFTRYNKGRPNRETEDYLDPEGAAVTVRSELNVQPTSVPSIDSKQDFPSLDGRSHETQHFNLQPQSFARRIGRPGNFAGAEDNQTQFAEDFPSLGGRAPAQTSSLQGQWTASQAKTTKTAAVPVQPKKKNSLYMQLTNDDFPSLPAGYGGGISRAYTSSNTVQNASSANAKKEVSKKPTRISPTSIALTSTTSSGPKRAAFSDDDFPTLVKENKAKNEIDWWSATGTNNSKNPKTTAVSGGSRTINVKSVVKKKDGNEKKSSSLYIYVPNMSGNQLSLQNVADSLLGDASMMSRNERSKAIKNVEKSIEKSRSERSSRNPVGTSSTSSALASNPGSGRAPPRKEQNGSTDMLLRNGKNKAFEYNENEKGKNEIPKTQNKNFSEMKNSIQNLELNDFPELPTTRRTNSTTAATNAANKGTWGVPPPGFKATTVTNTSKPPATVTNTSKPPPPGFNSTNPRAGTFGNKCDGAAYAAGFSAHQYHEPESFKERNQALIGKIQDIVVGDELHFGSFKTLSGQFRKGIISAADYYEQCTNLLGNQFFDIFPELLVLLPDIFKQKELLAVHNVSQRDVNDNMKGGQFLVCATCQQVLAGADFRKHMSVHDLDQTFPTLSNAAPLAM